MIGLVFIIAVCGTVLLWAHHSTAVPMDFIERHLGFSPDDSDGSMEVLLITVLFILMSLVGFRWASK
jgi:UDP-N-acetylmuramyl pentapeptide phosphotransferase/UDP-N-acetylglucosamine-1-phosphate transferase